jgi:hypothetical protein
MAGLVFLGAAPSGCYWATPPDQYGTYPSARARRRPVPPKIYDGFGYFSVGGVAHAKFFGEIEGVDSGTGFTITVPPIFPVAFACVATALVLDVANEGQGNLADAVSAFDDPAIWRSGIIDPAHHVISDFSLDLSYSSTTHCDTAFGGSLDYDAIMIGVRFGGPRRFVPRYYLMVGYGRYSFSYSSIERANASINGLYWGGGLELFLASPLALGVDYKVHHYFGDDDDGQPVDGGARHLAVLISLYW